MSYPSHCCSTPPVVSNYTPVGTIEKWGDMKVYTTGPKDAKHAVLVFYDVFGFCNNTKQFCDILAKAGNYRVGLPDFFLGQAPTKEMFFGMDRPKMMEWVMAHGSLPVILPLVDQVDKQLKADGAVSGTFVGFCWGAKMSAQLSATHPFFVGASLIHPSMVDNTDAEAAQIPILAIPTKQEPDMTEYMEILYKKPFGSKCQHHRFDDVNHGFAAALGDFEDEHNRKRVDDAIQLTVKFFNDCFNDEKSN